MSDYYILKGHEPVPVDVMTWARWFESADRRVAVDRVGDITVSTVFLGSDHNFSGGPPHIFETMTFGDGEERMQRYSTWEQAEAGHAALLASIKVESHD